MYKQSPVSQQHSNPFHKVAKDKSENFQTQHELTSISLPSNIAFAKENCFNNIETEQTEKLKLNESNELERNDNEK